MSSHYDYKPHSDNHRKLKSKRSKPSFLMQDILLEPGEDDIYGESDPDALEDCRIEIRNMGHNLTSVLINPRQTSLESMFDEFAKVQRLPLDSSTTTNTTTSSNSSSLSVHSSSSSSHSNGSYYSSHSSTHSNSSISSNYSSSSLIFTSSMSLFSSKSDDENLSFLMNRVNDAYLEYLRMHETYASTSVAAHRENNVMSTVTIQQNFLSGVMKLGSSAISHEELLKSFREVPEIFFKPEFTLQNIDMFNIALGTKYDSNFSSHPRDKRNSSDADAQEKTLALSKRTHPIPIHQQETLTKFLDIIELALLNNIWIRSPFFFKVLDDIRELQSLVSLGHKHIASLRKQYQTLSERISTTVLRIPKLHTRQRNEDILFNKISCMQRVLMGKTAIASMIEVEDYLSALEVVKDIRQSYQDELSGLKCMKDIGNQLQKYDTFISEVMCNKFVSLAIQFEEDITENMLPTSTFKGSRSDGLDDIGTGPNGSLDQLLIALIATDKLQVAINMYKSRLSDSVRLIVRTCILEYLTSFDPTLVVDALETSTENGYAGNNDYTPFAIRVREMTNENFLSCLSMCYENVLLAPRKAEIVHKFIETKLLEYQSSRKGCTPSSDMNSSKIAPIDNSNHLSGLNSKGLNDSSRSDETMNSNVAQSISTVTSVDRVDQSVNNMISLSKSCLSTACDLSQRSIVQLLSLRKESYLGMTAIEKTLNGSSAYIMRQSLLTQTKYFLESFHEGHKGKLINILDNEKWNQCDVSIERQSEIDRLVSGKAVLQSRLAKVNHVTPSSASDNNLRKDAKPAQIEDQNFNVVWSVLFLVEVILLYIDISTSFPLITSELISKIIELVRLFDLRSRQLVLGAQSIQSAARLKSISARHLAITAQSIVFLSALIPHIRAAVLAQLPAKQHILLQEFDRISLELSDHHNAIVSKFVSIVSDFIDSSAAKLRLIDWDRFQGQCEYFEDVVRNVSALHRVLIQLLPSEQLQDIFQRIFLLLNRKIPNHFEEIMPNTITGRQRILDDVSHLVTTFSRLKQIDCKQTTAILDEIFRNKYGKKDSATVSPSVSTAAMSTISQTNSAASTSISITANGTSGSTVDMS